MRPTAVHTTCLALVLLAGAACASDYPTNVTHWLPLDADGWSILTTSVDSRVVHVSSSTGNDSTGDGSVGKPYATVSKGMSRLRYGSPDWLLLKKGDVWYESLGHCKVYGRSQTEPLVITSYGSGPRPLLKTGSQQAVRVDGGSGGHPQRSNIAIVGLHFVSHHRDPDDPAFNAYEGWHGVSWLMPSTNVLVEDCCFAFYKDNIVFQSTALRLKDIAVRRNISVDSYCTNGHAQGIYCTHVNGLLIEENYFDHNGWHDYLPGAQGTIYNHDLYIQTECRNVMVRNNIISRGASHGCQLRPGGVLADNLIIRCGMAAFAGGKDRDCDYTYIVGNVVMDGADINSSTPRGHGLQPMPADILTIVEGNIVANERPAFGNGCAIFPTSDSSARYRIRYNTAYNWKCGNGGLLQINASYADIEARNNLLQDTTHGAKVVEHNGALGTIEFDQQIYYTTRAASQWFEINSSDRSLAQWQSQTADTNSLAMQVAFRDPTRSVEAYNAVLGGTNTYDAFMAKCRAQSKETWDTNYAPQTVIAWLREGFRPLESLGPEQIGAVWPPVPEPFGGIAAVCALLVAARRRVISNQ